MNERIKELSFEAHKFASRDPRANVTLHIDDIFEEKFTELIVRECAGLFPNVYVEIENEYGHTPVIAADYIKKHFGVEE